MGSDRWQGVQVVGEWRRCSTRCTVALAVVNVDVYFRHACIYVFFPVHQHDISTPGVAHPRTGYFSRVRKSRRYKPFASRATTGKGEETNKFG